MNASAGHFYRFAEFSFDADQNVLLRDNAEVALTPKTLALLRVLIENHGRIVEKEELLKALWGDSFVEEGNLKFTANQLRKALADDAQNPRFIETVPRRGYRFIAETEEVFSKPEKSATVNGTVSKSNLRQDHETAARSRPAGLNPRFVIGLSVILSISGLAFVSWYFVARSKNGSKIPILSAPRRSEPLSNWGNISSARISPDGKYIAYISQNQGTQAIWLRELATTTNLQLLPFSDEEYLNLMFSGKSDFIYFVRKPKGGTQDQGAIFRISIFGGVPTKLATNIQGWFSLSPVDDQIAFTRHEAGGRNVLLVSDADGNNQRTLAERRSPHEFRASRWSPDGSSIACGVGQADNLANEFGLSSFDARSGEEKQITPHKFYYISDLEWLPDQSGLLLSTRKNTTLNNQIWQVSAADGAVVPLFNDAANYTTISLDKEAKQMVATQVAPDFHLSVFDLADLNNSRVTVSADGAAMSFTRSGSVLYTATTNGQRDIFSMNSNGAEQRQLTNNNFDDFQPLASPDEKYIFFSSSRSGSAHVWRMNADGSGEVQITQTTGGFPLHATPDGRLFYWSALERNIWRVSVNGGDEAVFFEKRILPPAFSPDGKLLAYYDQAEQSGRRSKIVVIRVDSQETVFSFDLFSESAVPGQIAWSADGSSIFYAASVVSEKSIWRQPLDRKPPHKIADLGARKMLHFALSPNGEKFASISGEWKRFVTLLKGLK
jgi:Tol biopolymer transport system component/DNA-binding winged helix-turn-helix (wHTH) protein